MAVSFLLVAERRFIRDRFAAEGSVVARVIVAGAYSNNAEASCEDATAETGMRSCVSVLRTIASE